MKKMYYVVFKDQNTFGQTFITTDENVKTYSGLNNIMKKISVEGSSLKPFILNLIEVEDDR